MTYHQRRYKAEVSAIIKETLNNFISFELNTKEFEFKQWLNERNDYYQHRIENYVIHKKPKTKLEVANMVSEIVDNIKQVFETEKELEKGQNGNK